MGGVIEKIVKRGGRWVKKKRAATLDQDGLSQSAWNRPDDWKMVSVQMEGQFFSDQKVRFSICFKMFLIGQNFAEGHL